MYKIYYSFLKKKVKIYYYLLYIVPPCEQSIEAGSCKARMPRWAYDKYLKKCIQFNYGGCGGNDNRYNSKEECERACPCADDDDDKCKKPNEEFSECSNPCPPGAVCIAACIPGCVCKKGYYRDNNGDCVQIRPACEQDIVVGPCEALITSWAYDKNVNRCVKFYYGGCQGNDNRYASKEACENECPFADKSCGPNEHYDKCNSCE
jgi:papilin